MKDLGKLAATLLQHADDVVFAVRVGKDWHGGGVELVSERVREMLGYDPQDFLDDADLWFRSVHPQDRETLGQSTIRILSTGKPECRVYRLRHKLTREYRWMEDKCIPHRGANGKITRLVGFARDITQRLARSEVILQSILESTLDAMVAADENGVILKANHLAEELFGYGNGELDGRPLSALLQADSIARAKNAVEFPVDISLNTVTIDGRSVAVRVIRDSAVRLRMEQEKQALEQQFRQARKVEALGRLAGGVAHDFNNILMVINGHSDLLMKRAAQDDPSLTSLNEIRKAGQRAASLTQHLLDFGRTQDQGKKVLDLNRFVQDSLNMMRRVVHEDVVMSADLTPDLGQIEADPCHIDQLILNLVVNASDAMPNGGRLRFETRNVELDADSVRDHPGVAPGPFVELVIRDTGTGIDPEVLPHIFEVFFTTKGYGEGTGLGLSTVHNVVSQVGGFQIVQSELGVGTAFHVYLPRLAGRTEVVDDAPAAVLPQGNGETVLLVEDQVEVLQLVRTMLEGLGYTVLSTSIPAEALRIAAEHVGKIHLLLSDVVMPELSGPDLARRIQWARPNIKTVFMSGYTSDYYAANPGLWEARSFLQKPVSAALLSAKIREALGPPRPARIVVVDDEESVRSVVAATLQSAGYEVLCFENGSLAVEEAERNEIDLMITDLVMPKQEGLETIRQVHERWPHLKVIAMSGVFGGRYLAMAGKMGAHDTIAKPFLPQQLLEKVRELLHNDVADRVA
ncbi:MAG: response regulator [Candidatus Solibacter usitatus]|nr:response regulator [Candidatus Solibacter usitatus]